MIFSATDLEGVIAIDIEMQHDSRGYFARTMCRDEFTSRGLVVDYAQDSMSFNQIRGTLRGLHYQNAPCAETKIVRCVQGAIYDVLVDMRPGSKTYLAWQSFELSASNGKAVYVPEGLAMGSRRWQTRLSFSIESRRLTPRTPPPGSDTTTHLSRSPGPSR